MPANAMGNYSVKRCIYIYYYILLLPVMRLVSGFCTIQNRVLDVWAFETKTGIAETCCPCTNFKTSQKPAD